ncbi:hypothetical protein SYJ56_22875 [Algoriphagus sp. D3-2-R+10]|uniref:hypothetical protein n=1 Tax=Algoriphagus aurantiacus TaxID=3103948 RepID=UPI002B3C28F3|nr:hypothetical protein [Algoriphagus sp. D3-2-R+10]MEB2778172.1 hypothetical protein [Algoriphagus sp. D3-2-R+10]
MKKPKRLIIILLLAGFSCEVNEAEEPVVEEVLNKDYPLILLQSDLFTPPGQIRSIDFSQFEFERHISRTDLYYDKDGNNILSIGINMTEPSEGQNFAKLDTIGATVYIYELDQLLEEHNYDFRNGNFGISGSRTYSFDDLGRRYQEFDQNEVLRATYFYNDSGQLESKKYGENQEMEWDQFIYDDQDRLLRQVYWGSGDAPLRDFYYRYNALGKLEAKETWELGSDSRKDAFQYFYNGENQLVEEIEYDPNFGFIQLMKKEYSYFSTD